MICNSLRQCLIIDLVQYEPEVTVFQVLSRSLVEGRVLAVILMRVSQYLHSKKFFWRLSPYAKRANEILTGFECSLSATVGNGIFIAHTQNIVIGDGVVIGDRVTLYNGTTLGAARRQSKSQTPRYPVLGNEVTVFSGAKVLDAISIGNGATVGANSVVLHDVMDNEVVVGSPARATRNSSVDQ
ncbi:Serine acetyltransferase [Rubripirellula obstinata]|uniref:Serine acetyltransferase n=1 Tax=Rubripirellula obstinata TaxID=406547 RepID=A0A5B1CL14_9BACT|nr:hypothetical protein [Rubripirellula obstinata]KAA1261001.1 Serine acetyltransferase [Rubripirellula obstinata]